MGRHHPRIAPRINPGGFRALCNRAMVAKLIEERR